MITQEEISKIQKNLLNTINESIGSFDSNSTLNYTTSFNILANLFGVNGEIYNEYTKDTYKRDSRYGDKYKYE